MAMMLWDNIESVACTKVCCSVNELFICQFNPIVIQPTVAELAKHIKPNKFLVQSDGGDEGENDS
jgi:hypothetical protein